MKKTACAGLVRRNATAENAVRIDVAVLAFLDAM